MRNVRNGTPSAPAPSPPTSNTGLSGIAKKNRNSAVRRGCAKKRRIRSTQAWPSKSSFSTRPTANATHSPSADPNDAASTTSTGTPAVCAMCATIGM